MFIIKKINKQKPQYLNYQIIRNKITYKITYKKIELNQYQIFNKIDNNIYSVEK